MIEKMIGDWTPLLVGTVGSHAYGLAGPDSDVDTLAFAAAPTARFHGLSLPTGKDATKTSTDPDAETPVQFGPRPTEETS